MSLIDEDLLSCQDLAEPVAELSQPLLNHCQLSPSSLLSRWSQRRMIWRMTSRETSLCWWLPQCVTRRETGNAAAATPKEVSTLTRGSVKKNKKQNRSVGSALPSFDKLTTPRTVRHDGYPVVGFKYASHQKFILRLYRLAMDNPSYTSTAELWVCLELLQKLWNKVDVGIAVKSQIGLFGFVIVSSANWLIWKPDNVICSNCIRQSYWVVGSAIIWLVYLAL